MVGYAEIHERITNTTQHIKHRIYTVAVQFYVSLIYECPHYYPIKTVAMVLGMQRLLERWISSFALETCTRPRCKIFQL